MTDDPPVPEESMQLTLALDDKPITRIYVASALTALTPEDRSEISHRCEVIDRAIISASGTAGMPWEVHLPVVWSAPGRNNDDRTPKEIYDLNREHVRRASGLVLLGDHGGSLGAGQEFAWAIARRLPVLLLLKRGAPLSRQIAGTPAQMTVREVDDDESISRAVEEWVHEWRVAIESRARSGTGELIIALRASHRLRDAFVNSADSIEAIAAVAGLNPDRVAELFEPSALLDGSVSELIALSGALGLDAGEALNPNPIPELSPNQRTGLAVAAQEYDWTPPEVLQIESRARLELAKGGVRRLPLTSVQDWVFFASRYVLQ